MQIYQLLDPFTRTLQKWLMSIFAWATQPPLFLFLALAFVAANPLLKISNVIVGKAFYHFFPVRHG